MNQLTKDLRGLLQDLDNHAATLHEAVAKGSLSQEETVAIGRVLVEMVKKANSALEPLKIRLREDTLAEAKGKPGPYYFHGEDGSKCMVVVPKQVVVIRKGTDMSALKDDLGPRFPLYFMEKVSYAPCKDFGKTASGSADPDEIKKVLSVVDFNEGTPRVSFRD